MRTWEQLLTFYQGNDKICNDISALNRIIMKWI